MTDRRSFDSDIRAGRLVLLAAAYAPVLAVLGLRVGFTTAGWALVGVGVVGSAVWVAWLEGIATRHQTGDFTLGPVEILDRDAAAYVATYLLPVLAAKPNQTAGYLAYLLTAGLILVVAYRAELGAVNPLGYALGYRAYRVRCEDRPRIVLSKRMLTEGEEWEFASVAGLTVALKLSTTKQSIDG